MKLVSDQVSEQEVRVILRELDHILTANVSGDIVEFGCYVGTTSLHIQHAIENTSKVLHVYDSFEGLPDKSAEDASPAGSQFVSGELSATKAEFAKNFRQAHVSLPIIHKGWFDELTQTDVPSLISFAFLDGDYYQSILDPLKLIWPVLSKGAVIVVDDYQNEQLPGVQKALDTWALHHTFKLKTEASLAIINVLS